MVQFLFALGWTKNIQEEQEAQLMLQLTLMVDTMAVVDLNAEEPSPIVQSWTSILIGKELSSSRTLQTIILIGTLY